MNFRRLNAYMSVLLNSTGPSGCIIAQMQGGVTMTSGIPSSGAEKVWRYMSFSRFVWMLQRKQLWLARADLLGDPWEMALTGDQLEFLTRRQPPWPIPLADEGETAEQRFARFIPLWRRSTFVNCWSKLEHESHALWRIYCKSVEGVAVQTTLSKLADSVGALTVCAVTYENPGKTKQTPGILDVVTKKPPWYDYEQEVRLVRSDDVRKEASSEESVGEESLSEPRGHGLEWDPEINLESIRVHPDADDSFMETVSATVEHYAPALKNQVEWSEMRTRPKY